MEKRRSKRKASAFLDCSNIIFQLSYARRSIEDVRSFKTPDELLVKLVYDRNDDEFQAQFLRSYQVFPGLTPEVLLDAFRTMWDTKVTIEPANEKFPSDLKDVRESIANLISLWVQRHGCDMETKKFRKRLLEFVEAGMSEGGATAAALRETQSALSEKKGIKARSALLKSFMDADPGELSAARTVLGVASKAGANSVVEQLSAMEAELLSLVSPAELFQLEWMSGSEPSVVTSCMSWFNKVANNIGQSIANQENEKAQTAMLKRAISMALRAHALHNYNLVMEVLSGLFRHTMQCDKAWEGLQGKIFDSFMLLCETMAASENFARLREEFDTITETKIPYLAGVLSDLLFVDEFNDTSVSSGLNFAKAKQFGHIVADAFSNLPSGEGNGDYSLRATVKACVLATSPLYQVQLPQAEEEVQQSPRMKALSKARMQHYIDPSFLWDRVDIPFQQQKMRTRDWKVLETAGQKLHFKKDDIIYEPGAGSAMPFFLLKYGHVRVEQFGVVVKVLREGSIFGDASILEPMGKCEPAMYICDRNCMVQCLEPSFVTAMLSSDPRLAQKFLSHLAKELVARLSEQATPSQSNMRKRRKRSKAQLARSCSKLVVKKGNEGQADERDSDYRTLFSLSGDQLLIQDFRASLHVSGIPSTGTLYVSSQHVCFYSKVFSYTSKIVLEMDDILDAHTKAGKLVLQTTRRKKEYAFRLKEDGKEEDALALIMNLRSSARKGTPSQLALPSIPGRKKRRGTVGSLDEREGASSASTSPAVTSGTVSSSASSSSSSAGSASSSSGSSSSGALLSTSSDGSKSQSGWEKLALNEENWEMILKGAKVLNFKPGETILEQGKKYQRIFQVSKGRCRVELNNGLVESLDELPDAESESAVPLRASATSNQTEELAILRPGEMFGEISFVRGDSASASVKALTHVSVCVIEGTVINRLLQVHPDIGAKFLHYVCSVLATRLYGRLFFETREQASVRDIVAAPIHLNLENLNVKPAEGDAASVVVHAVSGPHDEETEEPLESTRQARPWVCGKAISTYPRRREGHPRDGHPICDQYMARFFERRVVASIADGCNWGTLPRDAARRAIAAFVDYMCAHHGVVKEVVHAGSLLLRAFAMAQLAVIGDDPDTPVGSTTLLGGVVLELDEEDLEGDVEGAPKWGFVYGSVGDTKAFHYSPQHDEWHDITESNRAQSRDATDCGGRLGRMTSDHGPDLRNFELGFFPCDRGDLIILVSDGVHDNLDPESLGKNPRALGLEYDSWGDCPLDDAEVAKSKFRLRLLRSLLNREGDGEARGLEPAMVVDTLLSYCEDVNAAAVNWMVENPSKPLPKDYQAYPGKMDHTTCLGFIVGGQQ